MLLSIAGCEQEGTRVPPPLSSLPDKPPPTTDGMSIAGEDTLWNSTDEYATVYITVADTGHDYRALALRMYGLAGPLLAEVDTMGRIYDPESDSLIVPRDDEDEMWAGAYFPRRYGSVQSLSIEYLSWYTDRSAPGTFALFTGIWPTRVAADSAASAQRRAAPGTFVLEASIYMGCMH